MASSLYPPNCYSLSDAIIVNRPHSSYSYAVDARTAQTTSPHTPLNLVANAASVVGNKRVDHDCNVRLPSLGALSDSPRMGKKHEPLEVAESGTPEQARTRRERCRINQARYRSRQRKRVEDLQESIQHLKEAVYKLEIERSAISSRTPTHASVWNVAAEYFRLFRHGYMAPTMLTEQPSTSSSRAHPQLKFLKETMASDVTDGVLCGPEALLESWRLLSLYHDGLEVQLERLENGPGATLVATTSTSVTISENTLRYAFPHLMEEDEELSAVGRKLLNQRVLVRGSVTFYWDSEIGRVVRLQSNADLLSPILSILGSLENVATAFNGAQITLSFRAVGVSH